MFLRYWQYANGIVRTVCDWYSCKAMQSRSEGKCVFVGPHTRDGCYCNFRVRAFHGVFGEGCWIIKIRVALTVGDAGCFPTLVVLLNQRVVEAIQSTHVAHHACWTVYRGKKITEQLLSYPTNLVDVTCVV